MDVAELFPSLACIATILLAMVCTAKMKKVSSARPVIKYINVFRKQHDNPNKHANDKELQNIFRSISFYHSAGSHCTKYAKKYTSEK